MDECPKCGKKLSWIERRRPANRESKEFYKKYPELQGRKLCASCYCELVNRMNRESSSYYDKFGRRFEQPFKDALEEGRRIVVIKDNVLSVDGIGKHIEEYSRYAEKFGYVFKSESHFVNNSFFNSIGISLSIIFEKVIPTANETNFVNCEHCTTRYDANQYFKCPQCGSPAT